MRDRSSATIYRYLVFTLLICCLGVTFLIYSSDDNKNFVRNPIDKNSAWYQFFTNGIKDISSSTLEDNISTIKDNVQK